MATRESRPGVDSRAARKAFDGAESSIDAVDSDNWRADAEEVVLMLAASGQVFDAERVRAAGVREPAAPNQWGALFASLRKAGYIEPIGTTTSGRRQRHAGLNRLWIGTEFVTGDAE
ncbi:hypothetical protein [Propionimicrobium sp. PCR01-08-3]|uniref:hypothetical protein n=1 Tax=Propionimicrobium sp. PCR01-08-3 TaxID=3052086 RepID=UPI00255CA74A|nr:hypothetical protein [Propionimicrobium sp. PCR01-08-3]WIY82578.1 hypothetical protein QQ658_13910 [Propionimicrobium sp. PCR01-08-3]